MQTSKWTCLALLLAASVPAFAAGPASLGDVASVIARQSGGRFTRDAVIDRMVDSLGMSLPDGFSRSDLLRIGHDKIDLDDAKQAALLDVLRDSRYFRETVGSEALRNTAIDSAAGAAFDMMKENPTIAPTTQVYSLKGGVVPAAIALNGALTNFLEDQKFRHQDIQIEYRSGKGHILRDYSVRVTGPADLVRTWIVNVWHYFAPTDEGSLAGRNDRERTYLEERSIARNIVEAFDKAHPGAEFVPFEKLWPHEIGEVRFR